MRPPGLDDANRLYTLVRRVLGHRVTVLTLRSASAGVQGVLYDAFVFTLGIEDPHRNLTAAIRLVDGHAVTAPFGTPFTLQTDDESVGQVLRQMDEWARLRLPDKFLERFDAALVHAEPGDAEPEAPVETVHDIDYFAQITYRDGNRVPVRVFRSRSGIDEVYHAGGRGWTTDDAGTLDEDRRGVRDHEIWPITRLQAGQSIAMIESGVYRRLDVPGLLD